MNTVGTTITKIRALLGDRHGDWATEEFLLPYMNIAQEMLFNQMLTNPVVGRPTTIFELPNVTGKTLASYFAQGQPLERLEEILAMYERSTSGSRDDLAWELMDEVMTDALPFAGAGRNYVYRFTGDDIQLPGISDTFDLRIVGAVQPQMFTSEADTLIPGTVTAIEFRAAGLAALPRGSTLGPTYLAMAETEQDALLNRIVMALQRQATSRLRGVSGRVRAT